MSAVPPPRLTAVTLGVRDVPASARFYAALGFARKFPETGDEIAFFDAGGLLLAVWDWEKRALDAAQATEPRPAAFRGTTLAWNCGSREQVDAAYAHAIGTGATPLRAPSATDYGGYRGYFADPDGHVWEIVQAPGMTVGADGRLVF